MPFQTTSSAEKKELDTNITQRNILIEKADKNSLWLGVYDEGIEPPATNALIELGKFLSEITKSWVIGVSVYDSDVLELQLFESGTHLDTYISRVGNEPSPKKDFILDDTRLLSWRPLLHSDAELEQLKDNWQNPQLEAENILYDTARLLSIDPERVMLSATTILKYQIVPFSEFTRLYAEKSYKPTFEQLEGLPKFIRHSGTTGPLLIVGRDLSTLHCTFENQGGASEGLKILLKGNALDQQLIQIDSLKLFGWTTSGEHNSSQEKNKPYNLDCHLEPFEDEKGDKGLQITLPQVPLIGGIKEADASKDVIDYRRVSVTHSQARILIKLVGQSLNFGYGKLYLNLIPLSNPQEGQGQWVWQIEPMF